MQAVATEPASSSWSLVYEKAIADDGRLFFPERLTTQFLTEQRKVMGSYLFANQYQNEIIPDDEKQFRLEWLRYYKQVPSNVYTFAFIDPAIGQKKTSDYTGVVIVSIDCEGTWYLKHAHRARLKPTEIVNLVFEIQDKFKCNVVGVESVAYQEALLYMIDEESRRRGVVVPVTGIKPPTDRTKEMRILGLVPRFEWGRILLAQGLHDFETEYSQFPRGAHDDVIDALANIEEIAYMPKKEDTSLKKPHSPQDPNYERWLISQIHKQNQNQNEDD